MRELVGRRMKGVFTPEDHPDLEDNMEHLDTQCEHWLALWCGNGPDPRAQIRLIKNILQQMKARQDALAEKLNNLIPKETDDAESKETTS